MLSAVAVLALTLISLWCSCFAQRGLTKFAGPYRTQLDKLENCPLEASQEPRWLGISTTIHNIPKTPAEPQRISARANFSRDLTDEFAANAEMAQWTNNQWVHTSFGRLRLPHIGSCSLWKKYMADFSRKLFGIDPEAKGACVIRAGQYSMNNTVVNWTHENFPEFIYGRFQVKSTMTFRRKVAFCGVMEMTALPIT